MPAEAKAASYPTLLESGQADTKPLSDVMGEAGIALMDLVAAVVDAGSCGVNQDRSPAAGSAT